MNENNMNNGMMNNNQGMYPNQQPMMPQTPQVPVQPMSNNMNMVQPGYEQQIGQQMNPQNFQQQPIQPMNYNQQVQQPTPVPVQNINQAPVPNSAPIAPVNYTEPQHRVMQVQEPVIEASVVEESIVADDNGEGDGTDATFDYNALYGIQTQPIEDIKVENSANIPTFTEQEIVIDNTIKSNSVVPEFNADALSGNINANDKLTDNILNDTQQSKADTKRSILFIGILVVIIIVAIFFVFPIMAGYNL